MARVTGYLLAAALSCAPLGFADGLSSEIIADIKLNGTRLDNIPMLTLGEKKDFPTICQAMCIAEKSCVAFTVRNSYCYLKSEVRAKDFKAARGAVSGVVRGN